MTSGTPGTAARAGGSRARRIVVVGSGVAGLTAVLAARAQGWAVTLVTKAELGESSTRYAQGGIAAVLGDAAEWPEPDSTGLHVADTLRAGAGLSERDAAETVCGSGADVVAELLAAGVRLDVADDGVLARGLEAAHSRPRILHAHGDATGAAIIRGLAAQAAASGAEIREHTVVTDLLLDDGRVRGVRLLEAGGAELEADAVVLATGGAGHLYPRTTNPAVTTGDGMALALRAGALLADVEFVQFHPTALALGEDDGNVLVSEAVRGEGAVLRDTTGIRFMPEVHPDAELAPRDVVARAIARRMRETGAPVLLDATGLGADFLARRFPTIDTTVRAHGLDWSREPVPVAPATHYLMGGVATDDRGRSSVPGLLAVGEVACTGLHGANRLASNSLLEGAALGRRAVETLTEPWPEAPPLGLTAPARLDAGGGAEPWDRAGLQGLMWARAGLERDAAGLAAAADRLARWAVPAPGGVREAEDASLLLLARAVVLAALVRQESRGAHWRADFPEPADPPSHSAVVLED